jgi:hypothetical protein
MKKRVQPKPKSNAAPRETRNAQTAAEFNVQAGAAWQKQIESIVETGRILIEAKETLAHGEFYPMIRGELPNCKKLPFGTGTADMLMAIARHPVLSNPKFTKDLPPLWYPLYGLTSLPDEELEAMLKDGRINAELKGKEIREIIQAFREEGLYRFDQIPEALNTLLKFRTKHPDPSRIARFVLEEMAEGDHTLDLDDFAKVPPWLSDLHSACVASGQKLAELLQEEESPAAEPSGRPRKRRSRHNARTRSETDAARMCNEREQEGP